MAQITLKGNIVTTNGELPKVGSTAPNFSLTKTDLSEISLSDLKGKKIVLNIFPSLDTAVCAASVRKFNAELNKLNNTTVLCISKDLPFAHKRFCEVEGLANVISASEYKNKNFGDTYKVEITSGPLAALFARSIVVIDENGVVTYTELVPEITQEPNYDAALAAIK